ncbi:MAG: hypothetical protein RSC24_06180 [Clostridium sp.]
MNKGQLTSVTYCKKCHEPIEIFPHWEGAICKSCGQLNNLKYNYAEKGNLTYYDNTTFLNELESLKPATIKKLNVDKIKTLDDIKRVLEFLDIKVDTPNGLVKQGFDKV